MVPSMLFIYLRESQKNEDKNVLRTILLDTPECVLLFCVLCGINSLSNFLTADIKL